jgi:hypothetical protein
VFPSKGSLETFSKISEILLSVHGIKIKIMKFCVDPDAVEVLHPAWVKIFDLPKSACKEEVVMKVAALVGEPVFVDKLSLIKTGPVRVKMNCIDPTRLRGTVRIFFNRVGYDIRFVAEDFKEKRALPPPPGGDLDNDGEECERDSDEDCDRKHRKGSGKETDLGSMSIDRSGKSGSSKSHTFLGAFSHPGKGSFGGGVNPMVDATQGVYGRYV